MNQTRFLMLLEKARRFSHLGERPDYWHGYQRGLRRGYLGELFGTDGEHQRWMRLVDDDVDHTGHERGLGYRDGLTAFAAADVATDGGTLNEFTPVSQPRTPRNRTPHV